ncbi:hypothetical protein NDU88_000915 [Pleurodeles waltl]|uniref:Sterol 26-hydroxylase, mitochondrial n=1 Tax=Pleurodeles waltl TaxID=8319 RepID=A0AAV7U4V1_PLEWA|nr:hypothetical protein NDU88_000915 [Pleurodeles waltl]
MAALCARRLLPAPGTLLLPTTCWAGLSPRRTKANAAGATVPAGGARLKGYEDLPGPSLLKNLYYLFAKGYLLRTHELQLVFKQMYGPMWKSTFGPYKNVNIASPEMLEIVLRREGKYPMRCDMAVWREHRDVRDFAYGPLTEEGERWYQLRTILNKRMLKPMEVVRYTGVVNEVVTDLLIRLQEIRSKSSSGVMVCDMANVLYRFSFEGISAILFETRMGCLEEQVPPETQKFINSIGYMLKNSVFVTILPGWTRGFLPFWKNYLEGWDIIFSIGKKLIDKKMKLIQDRLAQGTEVEGEYLTYLIASGNITLQEVYGSMAELLLAGVDTTSNTLSWTLYHLANDPEIQNALYQEVIRVIPGCQIPTTEHIAEMPLLKAVIKETLRLYPVVPTNSRVSTEKEISIGEYSFPKNTLFALSHFALSRDATNFSDPDRFLPQRWLRGGGMKHHPFSSIPFGYGVRGCIGRRIAELEMHLALSRIIQMFEVRPDPKGVEVKAISRIVMVADKPIDLQFIQRSKDKEH